MKVSTPTLTQAHPATVMEYQVTCEAEYGPNNPLGHFNTYQDAKTYACGVHNYGTPSTPKGLTLAVTRVVTNTETLKVVSAR